MPRRQVILHVLNNRRDSTRVIYEILELAKEGVSTSQIVRLANLNSHLARKYVMLLSTTGTIQPRVEAGVDLCKLTPKGERVLALLTEYHQELRLYPSYQLPSRKPRTIGNGRAYASLPKYRASLSLWSRVTGLYPVLAAFLGLLAGIGIGYLIP